MKFFDVIRSYIRIRSNNNTESKMDSRTEAKEFVCSLRDTLVFSLSIAIQRKRDRVWHYKLESRFDDLAANPP